MSDSALLTQSEIVDLTGKVKYRAQCRALTHLGVRHIVRLDGSPIVARGALAKLLGSYSKQPTVQQDDGPVISLEAIDRSPGRAWRRGMRGRPQRRPG